MVTKMRFKNLKVIVNITKIERTMLVYSENSLSSFNPFTFKSLNTTMLESFDMRLSKTPLYDYLNKQGDNNHISRTSVGIMKEPPHSIHHTLHSRSD